MKDTKNGEIPLLSQVDLRDYFSAKAMQALIINAGNTATLAAVLEARHELAKNAVCMADAMLEARDK